jgi:hypothetical protein
MNKRQSRFNASYTPYHQRNEAGQVGIYAQQNSDLVLKVPIEVSLARKIATQIRLKQVSFVRFYG